MYIQLTLPKQPISSFHSEVDVSGRIGVMGDICGDRIGIPLEILVTIRNIDV